jgi:hypothetical protein
VQQGAQATSQAVDKLNATTAATNDKFKIAANGIKYFNMALGFEATCHIARRWDVGVSLDLDLSSRSEENNDLISPEARLWQTGVFLKYRIN